MLWEMASARSERESRKKGEEKVLLFVAIAASNPFCDCDQLVGLLTIAVGGGGNRYFKCLSTKQNFQQLCFVLLDLFFYGRLLTLFG